MNKSEIEQLQIGDFIHEVCDYHWHLKYKINSKPRYIKTRNSYVFSIKQLDGLWKNQIDKVECNVDENNYFLNSKEANDFMQECLKQKKENLKDKNTLIKELFNIAQSYMSEKERKLYNNIIKELK